MMTSRIKRNAVAILLVFVFAENLAVAKGALRASDYLNDLDGDNIPGKAGIDYPVYAAVPENIIFPCADYDYAGYFGDVGTGCQVYHVCYGDGRQAAFLCPNGTVFHQRFFVCDWWFHFNCDQGPSMYALNKNRRLPLPPAPHPKRIPKRLPLNRIDDDQKNKNKARVVEEKKQNPIKESTFIGNKNPVLKEEKKKCECTD